MAEVRPALFNLDGVTNENIDEILAKISDIGGQPDTVAVTSSVKGRALNLSTEDVAATTSQQHNFVTTMKTMARGLDDVSMDDEDDFSSMSQPSSADASDAADEPRQLNGSILAVADDLPATPAAVVEAKNAADDASMILECRDNGITHKVSEMCAFIFVYTYVFRKMTMPLIHICADTFIACAVTMRVARAVNANLLNV